MSNNKKDFRKEEEEKRKIFNKRDDITLTYNNQKGKRNIHEPSGEAESLYGKITKAMMGDHIERNDPKEIVNKLEKYRKDIEEEQKKRYIPKKSKKIYEREDIGGYKPSAQTKRDYAELLSLVQELFTDQPFYIIQNSTSFVLDILKSDETTEEKYTKMKNEISNEITEDHFSKMYEVSGNITDYNKIDNGNDEDDNENNIENDEFDSEEEEDKIMSIVNDSSEENQYQFQEIEDENDINEKEMKMEEDEMYFFEDIDTYWLQKTLNVIYRNDQTAQQYATVVEQLLGNTTLNDETVHHQLMTILGQEHFSMVDMFVKNREEIIGRIQIARTLDEKIKNSIRMQLPSYRMKMNSMNDTNNMNNENDNRSSNTTNSNKKMRVLDLEYYTFDQGNHLSSNQQIQLPPNSIQSQTKDYISITIPMIQQKMKTINLIPIEQLPQWSQPCFYPIQYLNKMQSTVYQTVFTTNENVLVCAPTSSGKTTVALLSILHEIEKYLQTEEQFKIIYLAPMKSLVQEMVGTLRGKLKELQRTNRNLIINVAEMSGDSSLTKKQLEETQVIVATPEKIDVITRKIGIVGSGNGYGIFEHLKLMIIDEIHLLHDQRGPVLESLIARIKLFKESNMKQIRLVGLSATLPNCKDVGLFLECKEEHIYIFGNEYRPVSLDQTFYGITNEKPFKQLQIMNEITFEKVKETVKTHQVLVFVHSRKDTLQTAKYIREKGFQHTNFFAFSQENIATKNILIERSKQFENEDVRNLIILGIGIHHAGMKKEERKTIEDLFAQRHLTILISTATLACGVNLPAHTVIIKGTQIYSPESSNWEELSPMDVMQMIGRAGRPQYDTKGHGIIITTKREMMFYMSLLSQQLPIESQLIKRLVDSINSEIIIGNIRSIEDGMKWITKTYYYICILRSPQLYGILDNDSQNDITKEQRRRDLIHTAFTLLHTNGLILYNKSKGTVIPTELGRIASYYYLTYETIKTMNDMLQMYSNEMDLIHIFTKSSEFKYISIRETEKQEVIQLMNTVPYPIKTKQDDPSSKINVLLQTYIGRLKLPGFVLSSDTVYISQSGTRIFRSLFELLLIKKWAFPTLKALELCKSIEQRLFNSQCPLRQLPKVSNDICKALERKDFPFERLFDLEPSQLGELINNRNRGVELYNVLRLFPMIKITTNAKPIDITMLRVDIELEVMFTYDVTIHGPSQGYWILIVDSNGEIILHYQYFLLKMNKVNDIHHLIIHVPIMNPLPYNYFVYCISDKYLHCTSSTTIPLHNLILPSPLFALKSMIKETIPVEQFIHDIGLEKNMFHFDTFNILQSHLYQTIVHKNDSFYVASHSGSGKSIIAEMCMYKQLQFDNLRKIIYVNPKNEERQLAYLQYSLSISTQYIFSETVEDMIKELTNEQNQNIQLYIMNVSQIEIYFKLPFVQNTIGLIILDDFQRITNDIEYEIMIPSLREIIKHQQIRNVTLSLPMNDYKSISSYLGIKTTNCFAFKPESRIYEISIQYEFMKQTDYSMRIQAMIQPTTELILHYLKQKRKTLVVVPSKKVLLKVIEQVSILLRKNNMIQWNNETGIVISEKLHEALEQNPIEHKQLFQCMKLGIGMMYSEDEKPLDEYYTETYVKDQLLIKQFFKEQLINLMIITFNEIENWKEQCDEIILMGTTYSTSKNIELEIETIHKLIGNLQENGKIVIYCESNKKEYLHKSLIEPLPVESRLIESSIQKYGPLVRVFNTEIANQRIKDGNTAIQFLSKTLFYQRLMKNPYYYFIESKSDYFIEKYHQSIEMNQQKVVISEFLSSLIDELFTLLIEMNFIQFDESTQTYHSTEDGLLTMNELNDIPSMEMD